MAASGGPVQDLCEEALCSICLEYFRDPVIIPECGHNFCRACLILCWGESETEVSCPQCRETVRHRNLIPNRPLANVAEKAKRISLQGAKGGEGKEGVCEKHQEPLKLFCKEDEASICVVCDRSKEHRRHEVVPLEEVTQEYKDQIRSCLENLRKERKRNLLFKADVVKQSQDLLKQMEGERAKMAASFRRLHQFLEEQEKLLLAQMAEVAKEIAAKRDEHLARLSEKLSSLESLIREMEEKLLEPASELLQDIKIFLQRSQATDNFEETPVAFPPALKWKIWDFSDINPFLEGVAKQFRDTLKVGLQLQQENVTLDPDTAHPYCILSEDQKCVRYGDECQDLPNNPERFKTYPYVLGREGFTAGRHFWEVTVESEGVWALGVARKSVERKNSFSCGPEVGIWEMGKWNDKYHVSYPPDNPVLSLREKPERIRVTLNCEGGKVSFHDADTSAHLYTFPAASFSGETLQPLFYMFGEGQLSLSA